MPQADSADTTTLSRRRFLELLQQLLLRPGQPSERRQPVPRPRTLAIRLQMMLTFQH